jgi:MFS family permease
MTVMGETKKIHYAWFVFISLSLMFFAAVGMLGNTNGLYLTPVAKEMGWTRTDASWYLTIYMLVMAFSQPIASRLLYKVNPKLLLGTAMTFVAVATGAASQFQTIMAWNISAIFIGLGQAVIMYLAVPILLGNWFNKKYATVLGIALALGTVGSAIANPVAGALIAQYGWRTARLIMSVAAWVIAMPGILFVIRFKPSDMGLKPYGYEEGQDSKAAVAPLKGVSAMNALKSPAMYMVILLAGAVVLYASMNTQIPGYATSVGLATTVGAFAMTILNFANMGGKVFLGWLTDRVGYLGAMLTALISGILGIIIILMGGGNVTIFYTGLIFFGLCFSSLTVMLPLVVKGIFGPREFGKIYSNVTMVQSVIAAFAAIIYARIFDITKSFVFAWQLNLVTLTIGIVLVVGAVKIGKKLIHE